MKEQDSLGTTHTCVKSSFLFLRFFFLQSPLSYSPVTFIDFTPNDVKLLESCHLRFPKSQMFSYSDMKAAFIREHIFFLFSWIRWFLAIVVWMKIEDSQITVCLVGVRALNNFFYTFLSTSFQLGSSSGADGLALAWLSSVILSFWFVIQPKIWC